MAKSDKPRSPGKARSADYELGYCKPPKHSQFPPNQSGNRRGGSAKTRARMAAREASFLDQVILDEAGRKIAINDNGVRSEITTHQAIARKLAISAAKGDSAAQKQYFAHVQAAAERRHAEKMTCFGLLAQYFVEQSTARQGAVTAGIGQAWPHPDDVVLDHVKCIGEVWGPIDALQAAPFVELVAEYDVWRARIAQLRLIAGNAGKGMRDFFGSVIDAIAPLLDTIRAYLPPSFQAQLEWDEQDVPASALYVEGIEGRLLNFALLEPECDEMLVVVHHLLGEAQTAKDQVRKRAKLNISANTLSVINRLKIERQNRDAGAVPGPVVPDFSEFYGDFAAEGNAGAGGIA